MADTKLVADCATGAVAEVALTEDELADRAAIAAAAAAEVPPVDPVQAIVQAVLSAADCPPGVRAAIQAVQQAGA